MESIQAILDERLKKANEVKRERSGKFSPSMLGRCYRAQYWNRADEPQSDPPDARALRIFKVGHLFHDFVQGLLPDFETEVKVESDDILGYADIVLADEVVDIKSVHSRSFWYMDKDGYDVNKEKFTNIIQVVCYAWLLKKPKIRLLFVSKDDLCIKEYGFMVSNWEDKLELELSTLNSFWAQKELPPKKGRAYGIDKKTKKSNECSKYCNFRTKCHAE